jgi:uncharacterized repeat protein (TIGR01451 family)
LRGPRREWRIALDVGTVSSSAVLTAAVTAVWTVCVVIPEPASADRPFAQRFAANAQGDIALVGNTLLSCTDSDAICASTRAGTATPASQNNNNAHYMAYVDVDGDGTTFNSSSATLTLPTGAGVLFAGLYWGGKASRGTGGSVAPASAAPDSVKLRPPGAAGYSAVTATTVDTSGSFYQSFADVTTLVADAGSGDYTVADADLGTGRDDLQLGGWALVVAYSDVSAPSRNLVVFDGFAQVASRASVTIPLTGFRTPLSGDVRSSLGFVAQEGDLAAAGDGVSIDGTALANAANPANNVFNSTVSRSGVIASDRDPDYVNTLGWDVDLFSTLNVLGNDRTSATVELATTLDTYAPGVVTIATDLYAPRIEATKTVDRATADLGDELTYTVRLNNSGEDAADALTLTDAIPAGTSFVPGSLERSAVGTGTACPAFSGGALPDPTGGQVVVSLGTGGRLGVGQTQCVRFRVRVADGGLASGTTIANRARADFNAATTGAPVAGFETAPAETTVRVPDLAIIKSHAPAFVPGGSSAFTINVRNDGDGATRGLATVRDTLAADFTLTAPPGGAGWACSTAGAPVTITCTRSDALSPGASYPPIVLPVQVSGTATPGSLSNTATVEHAADGNPDNDSATDAGAVSEPLVDLVVTKTAPDRAIDGTAMPYTITVTNRGVSPAPDVVVADTLPPTFAMVDMSPSQGTCDLATATCALGTLGSGASATIGLLTQPPFPDFPGDTDFTNTVAATSGGRETNPDDNSASVTRHSVNVVDVYAIVTISGPVLAGGQVTITYRIGNRGPQAADVHGTGDLIDLATSVFGLPGQSAELTHGPGECVLDSPGNNFCGFPAIAPGEERVVTQRATVPASYAGHTLRARIAGRPSQYEAATRAGDDTDEETALVQGVNVAVEKTRVDGTAAVPVGGEATFRLTARNAGGLTPTSLNLTATGVTVRDALPAGMTLVDAPSPCAASGQVVTCDAGTLALGEQRSFDLRVRAGPAAAGKTVTNVATVSADQADWRPEDDRAAAALQIEPELRPSEQPSSAAVAPPACISRRSFRIRVAAPSGRRLKQVTLFIAGKRLTFHEGKHGRSTMTPRLLTATVDLRGMPKGTFTVRIQAITRSGKRFSDKRIYRTCKTKRTIAPVAHPLKPR